MLFTPRWKIVLTILVTLGAVYLSLPNFISGPVEMLPRWLPKQRVNLGLDLRGGSYLLLQVDFKSYLKEQTETLMDDIRSQLRQSKIGYLGMNVRDLPAEENEIPRRQVTFTLRNPEQKEEAIKTIRQISRDIEVTQSERLMIADYSKDYQKSMRRKIMEQSIEIVRRRVDETGTKEPIIQRQGDDRILLQVPGMEDPEQLKRILGRTAKMTFHLMDDEKPFGASPPSSSPGIMVLKGEEEGKPLYYAIQKKALITGDMLVDANASFDGALPIVNFRFNNQGARKFAETTKANVGKPFAIVLDDKVISAPVIREPILGGSGMISGHFTPQSANDLALLLRAGALPAPLTVVEERTVGPSLGQDSIESGKKAAILGIILVVVFIIINYGLFGIFADIALIINTLLTLAALSLLQATLTLPGIAGIVLGLGMAIDANVLIYERIREEMRAGKSLLYCIDQGFKRAFDTIFDSNLTILIATLFLYIFGSGPVKGFAVTLAVGVLASMFTATVVTRLLVALWIKYFKPKEIPI